MKVVASFEEEVVNNAQASDGPFHFLLGKQKT